MATKSDFYVGRGPDSEWIGSVGSDGYPLNKYGGGVPMSILAARNEIDYRRAVQEYLTEMNGIFPHEGWPWPWDTSKTSDYAYAWDEWQTWITTGVAWAPATASPHDSATDDEKEDFFYKFTGEKPVFPDMSAIKNVLRGPRS